MSQTPTPGERRLARPPSERYADEAAPGPAGETPTPGSGDDRLDGSGHRVGARIALGGVVLTVLLGGVMALSAGLLVLWGAAGYLIGQAVTGRRGRRARDDRPDGQRGRRGARRRPRRPARAVVVRRAGGRRPAARRLPRPDVRGPRAAPGGARGGPRLVGPAVTDELRFRRPTRGRPSAGARRASTSGGAADALRHLLPRLWLEHFHGTSWLAETDDGRLAGFLVGFISQDDPSTAYVHMVASDPNRRHQGIGTVPVRSASSPTRGSTGRVVSPRSPGPATGPSIGFHRAVGFRVDDGPGTQPLYGTPAHVDHDGEGEDRVVFLLDL